MIKIRKNNDGSLDEIVAKDCQVHLEQMDNNHWWLSIANQNSSRELHVEFFDCKNVKITYDPQRLTTIGEETDTCPKCRGSKCEPGTYGINPCNRCNGLGQVQNSVSA